MSKSRRVTKATKKVAIMEMIRRGMSRKRATAYIEEEMKVCVIEMDSDRNLWATPKRGMYK